MLNKIIVKIIKLFFYLYLIFLGASSGGLSGAEKGLYDLGTYFGMYLLRDRWIRKKLFLFSSISSSITFKFIEKTRWLYAT